MEHIFLNESNAAEVMARLTPERRQRMIERALPGGQLIRGAKSLADGLNQAGALFGVVLRPIMAVLGEDQAVEVPGRFATVRADNSKALGVVGRGYAVHTTMDQLAPVEVLMNRGEFELVKVQQVGDGARVRVSGIIGATALERIDGKPDVLAHLGTFEATHDGLKCMTGALSTLRLVCLNGMTSFQHVASYKVRHTLNAKERLDEASRLILGIRGDAVTEAELFQSFARTRMSMHEMRDFSRRLLDEVRGRLDPTVLEQEELRKRSAKREREIEELLELFQHGHGNTGETLWDGYNSVTEWIDHKRTASSGRRRWSEESADFGAGNRIKGRALRLLRNR